MSFVVLNGINIENVLYCSLVSTAFKFQNWQIVENYYTEFIVF